MLRPAKTRHIAALFKVLLCSAMIGQLHAQTLFNRTYVEGRPIMVFGGVHTFNSGYLVSGMVADSMSPHFANAMVAHFNDIGQLTTFKEAKSLLECGIFLNNLIRTHNDDFAFTGYVIDTVPTMIFATYNPVTDTLIVFKYTTSDTYVFLGNALTQSSHNDFYVAGVKTDNSTGNGNVCLVRVDTNGNRIWEKFYNQLRLDDARSIIQLANGNLLLGAVRNDLNQTNERANTWLLEVDTGGNVVRQWFDPNDSTYVAEGLKQTQDGGFIYGAQKKGEQSINDVYKTATIVKLDSNFNKQWMYHEPTISSYTTITDIEELPNGSFIACGNKPYFGTDSNTVSGWIIKLAQNGNVIWERVYRGLNQTQTLNLLTDIDILPDGGLIAVGQCQLSGATPPQVGWFLKLDSNGCEVENCVLGIDEAQMTEHGGGIQVWPNPATEEVSIALQNSEVREATFILTDVNGKNLYRKTEDHLSPGHTKVLDLRQLPAGVYFITVQTAQGQAVKRVIKE